MDSINTLGVIKPFSYIGLQFQGTKGKNKAEEEFYTKLNSAEVLLTIKKNTKSMNQRGCRSYANHG